MQSKETYVEDLQAIRSMMERSSRFLSLSGLAGVFAGCFALVGAYAAYTVLYRVNPYHYTKSFRLPLLWENDTMSYMEVVNFLLADAAIVLVLSLGFGYLFTTRKAKRQGMLVWDQSAKRLIINLFLPLTAGGIFCIGLLYHGLIGLIGPATLIFYGLALINGSKYTLEEVRYLGICEIVLGLLSTFFIGYGLFFWAIGFGFLHIIYGTVMYLRYERKR